MFYAGKSGREVLIARGEVMFARGINGVYAEKSGCLRGEAETPPFLNRKKKTHAAHAFTPAPLRENATDYYHPPSAL